MTHTITRTQLAPRDFTATCTCGWSTRGLVSHVREMSADHRFTTGASRARRGARL